MRSIKNQPSRREGVITRAVSAKGLLRTRPGVRTRSMGQPTSNEGITDMPEDTQVAMETKAGTSISLACCGYVLGIVWVERFTARQTPACPDCTKAFAWVDLERWAKDSAALAAFGDGFYKRYHAVVATRRSVDSDSIAGFQLAITGLLAEQVDGTTASAQHTRTGNGCGYAGDHPTDNRHLDEGMAKAKKAQLLADDRLEEHLLGVTASVKALRKKGRGVFFIAVPLFYHSFLAIRSVLVRLLCNDSVSEVVQRHSLYTAAFQLVLFLARTPEFAVILLVDENGLIDPGSMQCLAYFVRELYKQVVFLQTKGHIPKDIKPMSTLIEELYAQTTALIPTKPKKDTHKHGMTLVMPITSATCTDAHVDKRVNKPGKTKNDTRPYYSTMKPLQFATMSFLDQPGVSYHFGAQAKTLSRGAGGVRLSREIASLLPNLPLDEGCGIYVRVAEENMHCLKALISGPPDTPYAYGLFEFDLYLPSDYPKKPPQLHFVTTGHGTVRFNPNLYNNGTVCLSLLGTWGGPGWKPSLSTLIQVFLSMQAMVFNAIPYINEPGYEACGNTAQARKYSQDVIVNTIKWAMIDQINSPPIGFEAVVKHHFTVQRERILTQLDKWKADTRTTVDVKTLQTRLAQL